MIVYKTTNLINGKIYIGQDSKNRPGYIGSGRIIIKAIKKYGKENFKKEILRECTSKQEMDMFEIEFINKFKSYDHKIGYNISLGGGGPLGLKLNKERKDIISKANKGKVLSKETKDKISKAHLGKKRSEEHKKNVSLNHHDVSGKNNPMYNKHHTRKTKDKISRLNKGRKHTKEELKKMRLNSTGTSNPNAKLQEKEVLKIRDLYFNKGKTITELSREYKVNAPCIYKIVKRKTWKHLP